MTSTEVAQRLLMALRGEAEELGFLMTDAELPITGELRPAYHGVLELVEFTVQFGDELFVVGIWPRGR